MNTLNTNNPEQQSKSPTQKVVAIILSLIIIAVGVWLAVQVVRFLPTAFSSLASIAEEVYSPNTSDTFTVSQGASGVASGESFTLSWNEPREAGTYRFRYSCVDGVAITLKIGNVIEHAACDEIITFNTPVSSIDISVDSEKVRTADIDYVLTFTKIDETEVAGEHLGTIAVTNLAIASRNEDDTPEEITPDEDDTEDTLDETDTTVDTTTPRVATEPEIRYVQFSYIPISLDNGHTDLAVSLVGTGYVQGKTFYPSLVVDNDRDAAIQIKVQNIGTKTSEEWDLDVELPNGEDYSRDGKKELKPNEYEIITIVFEAEDETGTESFEVDIDVDDDKTSANNHLRGSMRFVN